ncbi:alpha-1,2-fucosyltransferase [Methanolobus vulcani]|uniref:Glycosyl transferase family 11 n=1 Tax=Methanolobus vulcani TaxID=38026 RepID=A0A7Z8KMF8_9EURY|nr:alpha-1,2-fucosyltransferase [Methanolobus vulcani]TQD23846.1 hypothetical protein FKV42_11560 [Methanolobus vulcani]
MIVIAKKYGRLGNRLILFAHFIAFGIEHNVKIANPSFGDYAEHFQNISDDLFCRYPSERSLNGNRLMQKLLYLCIWLLTIIRLPFIKYVTLKENQSYNTNNEQFIRIAQNNKFLFVDGWDFRDSIDLHKHASIIRTYFAPNKKIQNNIKDLLGGVKQNYDFLIGIHIRHGDYKNWNNGKYFYELTQYIQIMENIEKIFSTKKIMFVVCSDVKQNVKELSKFQFIFCNNHFVQDMYSLAECDYIVGPPSTYSLWSSFYGNVPLYHITDPDAIFDINDFTTYGSLKNADE